MFYEKDEIDEEKLRIISQTVNYPKLKTETLIELYEIIQRINRTIKSKNNNMRYKTTGNGAD